ncbi:MAG TPA: 2-hydroxyacyl-CoA dehydratase [Kiritimatiellia bacterium]|nr:2-hydroxyacyl-CoA dehydratase [Kiritimatiellia bacterium]
MAENVNQIIDRIRALHDKLAVRFERVETAANQGRLRMVLDYIARHERHLNEALAAYQGSASRAVLDTWFKNTPGRPLEECLEKARLDQADTSAVLRSVLEMDRCLVDSFRKIAESAVAEEVREFFQQLVGMEEREEHRLIRDAIEMEDL